MIFAAFSIILSIQADTPKPRVETTQPDTFIIRRFQEIIQPVSEEQDRPLQEQLISLRAKLAIAERSASDAQKTEGQKTEPPSPTSLRASRARVDYYRHKVEELEEKIRREKKKPVH